MLGWRGEVSRSTPVLPHYEGMQVPFVKAPAPTHFIAHELPGSEQAVHRCLTHPEELGRLLKGEKSILFIEMLWSQTEFLRGSSPSSIGVATPDIGVGWLKMASARRWSGVIVNSQTHSPPA